MKVTLLHVLPVGAHSAAVVRAEQCLDYVLEGIERNLVEKRLVEGTNLVDSVLEEAQTGDHDLIVVGATEEPLFRNLLMGSVSGQIARRAPVTVVMVKRRSSPLHSFLRQTVLEPSTGARPAASDENGRTEP